MQRTQQTPEERAAIREREERRSTILAAPAQEDFENALDYLWADNIDHQRGSGSGILMPLTVEDYDIVREALWRAASYGKIVKALVDAENAIMCLLPLAKGYDAIAAYGSNKALIQCCQRRRENAIQALAEAGAA